MKGFIAFAIAFLLLHSAKSGEVCNTLLLQSHLLEGQRSPTSDQMPLCHSITSNCCKIEDSIKIFNEVASNVDPALLSFKEKMQKAISDLVTFNGMAQKTKFEGASSNEQTAFCATAEADFRAIVFEKIADDLRSGFDKAFSESRDYHLAYYCAICDFKAQASIDTSKGSITLNPRACMKRIINNKPYVKALNFDLIQYFKAAQKFLDCVSYDNYFNFPFLYKEEGENADKAQKCISKTNNDFDNFPAECEGFCSNMNIAGISPNLEGDAVFLDKIVDYLRGLITSAAKKKSRQRVKFSPFQELDKFQIQLEDPVTKKIAKSMLVPGRLLSEAPAAPKIGPPGDGASSEDIKAYYNVYYEELTFETNPASKELLKLQTNPYNLQQFTIAFSSAPTALDLTAYFNGLNFDVNKTELTKLTLKENKVVQPPDAYAEALCELSSAQSIKSITEDIKLAAIIVIPPEYITANETELGNAPVIPKEAAEIVDREEAMIKLAEEDAARASAAKAAPATGEAEKPAAGKRRLRNVSHTKHRSSRRHRRSNYRRHRRTSKHMSRNRKLQALYDFGDD